MTRFLVLISPGDFDCAAESLYRAGYSGAAEEVRGGKSFLAVVFESPELADLARRLLEAEAIACRREDVVEEGDPFAAFRESLSPFSVGRFRLDPREEASPDAEPDAVFLHIPANCAFGTGLHESTRGILRDIDEAAPVGLSLLDAGCGSAILSIAAVKKGARRAVAFDIDPEAVFEARRNLSRNGVADRVPLFAGGVEAIGGAFDGILANMIWEELAPIVPDLAERLRAGGTAIFSGILEEREQEACAGIRATGMRILSVSRDGEWRTIRAGKPG